ncbi:M60 family metallopeptidase, partial [Flavobacterium sp. CAU 1735]|uniref:M60 family metallopeptidase n=1 Tax=Flavobacterium sp. CAU 1735 TaxID=3140361 RepID=UPI003260A8E3
MKKLYFTLFVTIALLTINSSNAQSFPIKPYTTRSKTPTLKKMEHYRSCDNRINTLYHTVQYTTTMSDTLDFYFTHTPNIDTIVYTPRQDESQDGQWGEVEIWGSNDFPFTFQLLTTVDWQQTKDIKTLKLPGNGINTPNVIRFVVKSAYNNFSSVAEMNFYSDQPQTESIPDNFTIDPAMLSHLGDIKLPVHHGSASNYQPGENIEKSFDGDYTTLYHSNYSNKTFPITLEYNFTDIDQIDYMIYHPRKGNKNGVFGRIKVEARTATGDYQTLLEEYDCGFKSTASKIVFPDSFHNPAQVRITVLNAFNNFASAAEIEFYHKREDGSSYPHIFTDSLCSNLQPGVTESDIDSISNPFFKTLAQRLFNGSYWLKFRVQQYKAIPAPWNTRSIIKNAFAYSAFQNPTGIVFETNSTAVIFVADYDSNKGQISLIVRDFANENTGEQHSYPLKPGINKFTIKKKGLSYIQYYSNDSSLPGVKINIVTGAVNGFYSYNDSFSDWIEIISNSIYPKIDLVGEYFTVNISKVPLQNNALFTIKELLHTWNSIINLQFYQMGLVKYDLVPRNKMFGWVESKGGWYAGGVGAHFDLSWGDKSLTSIKNLELWGISHEFGHQNQMLNGLRWTGTTEVTNNIYSAYAAYMLGHTKLTRLEIQNNSYRGVSLSGNLYNICYNELGRKHQNIMSSPDSHNVFSRLIPFWQLQLYYAIAGAGVNAPTLEQVMADSDITGNTDYANWLGITAQTIRNTTTNYNNGEQIMNFVKFVSDAVQQDLTVFFTKTGFLVPIDEIVGDYTSARITITQADIDATKAYVASKNYPKPQSPVIHYITARNLHMYKNNLAVEGIPNTGFIIDNTTVPGKTYYKIAHNIWKNAVAFETIDASNEVLFITTYATGDTKANTTMVLFPENAVDIYAVGANGKRIAILSDTVIEAEEPTGPTHPDDPVVITDPTTPV